MRKVIAALALSTDGFIEGQNGETDWFAPMFWTDEEVAFRERLKASVDTVFYGRVAYERFGVLRPCQAEIMTHLTISFAPSMRKYVFSEKMKHVPGKRNGDLL
jgi:dihydrofolate reductase